MLENQFKKCTIFLRSWFTDGGFLVVAGNIVPFDTISIEIVQHSKAGLLMWGNLSSGSVVRLGKTSASSMRPVS